MANSSGSAARNKTAVLALIGVMTAVTCILAPMSLSIPISPVPISLTHIAVFLSVYALGMKNAVISYLIYLLLGFAGLPVFSGYTGGPAKFMGPTGGYLIGFIFMAAISGWCVDHSAKLWVHLTGMVLGAACCYLFGTIWLARQMDLTFSQALSAGVIPFLPGDAVKIALCLIIGPVLRRQLRKAGLFYR